MEVRNFLDANPQRLRNYLEQVQDEIAEHEESLAALRQMKAELDSLFRAIL